MKELLKDRLKQSMVLAAFFAIGLVWLLFSLYTLPTSLGLTGDFSSTWSKIYILVIAVFGIGISAYFLVLNSKKEVVVFVEKKAEDKSAEQKTREEKNAIGVEEITAILKRLSEEKEISQNALLEICKKVEAGQGALYIKKEIDGKRVVEMMGSYALPMDENNATTFNFGEGLVGQSASMKKTMYIDDIPEGYIKIVSGLGSASPRFLSIVPLIHGEDILGVIELASFKNFSKEERDFVEKAGQLIADKLSGNLN